MRFRGTHDKTIGDLYLYVEDRLSAVLKTLELPWLDNRRNVSCIPEGVYNVSVHPRGLSVENVPNRSGILFHVGNYTKNTRGCILPGLYHDDIDGDGITDVVHSASAMSVIRHYIKDGDIIKLTVM